MYSWKLEVGSIFEPNRVMKLLLEPVASCCRIRTRPNILLLLLLLLLLFTWGPIIE